MATKKHTSKTTNFFKKNIYYILLFVCLAAIATIITLAVVLDKKPDPAKIPDEPVVVPPITFLIPVLGEYTFGNLFEEESLILSSTNEQYEPHLGIDIKAGAGAQVVAVLDGKVIDVEEDYDYSGLIIRIQHGDDTVTVYKCLAIENNTIVEGQNVKRGDVIGKIAEKTLEEVNDGPHLHFEVWSEGVEVDPMDYYPETGK